MDDGRTFHLLLTEVIRCQTLPVGFPPVILGSRQLWLEGEHSDALEHNEGTPQQH